MTLSNGAATGVGYVTINAERPLLVTRDVVATSNITAGDANAVLNQIDATKDVTVVGTLTTEGGSSLDVDRRG